MGLTPQMIGGIASGVGGLISGISGLIQSGKANKMLKKLQYPEEKMPVEYEKNLALAEDMARTGMPSEQYNQAMRNIQRQQLTALRYAGANYVPQILQGTNDATLNLDAQNAAMKIQNQKSLIGVRGQLGDVKRDIYDKNVRNKYNQDWNYAMSLKGAGNQNLVGGIDKLATGGLMMFGGYGGAGRGGRFGGYDENNKYLGY